MIVEEAKSFSEITSDPRAIFAGIAIIISVISLIYTFLDRQRGRIDSIIQGLRGDRASVAYTALQIRLTNLLSKRKYRQALISALLLSWNFEQSDRARASVLMALLDAKKKYPKDYDTVIDDLTQQFNIYGSVKGEKEIERGTSRLKDVLEAITRAEKSLPQNTQPNKSLDASG
ncbi:MAG TPA: hypothetical protein VF596_04100 [Pyrinomonadaceae bacterium]|jgi:hypothetical protein